MDEPEAVPSDTQNAEPFDALELSTYCLSIVDDVEVGQFWNGWVERWNVLTAEWSKAHEKTALEAAREVRRRWKGKTIKAEDLEIEIESAATAARIAISEPHPLEDIQDVFSTQHLLKRSVALKEAKTNLDRFEETMNARAKKDDEDSKALATLAAAKAKMLGRPSNHVKKLKLPVKEYRPLETGTGIRKGVSHRTGHILEVLRQIRVQSGILSLRSRGVDDEWVEQIAVALRQPWSRPIGLDLSANRISSAGCAWLSLGLAASTTLTSLNLSGNLIDRDGLDFLADGLLLNTLIKTLSLGSNKFGEELVSVANERTGNIDNARRTWSSHEQAVVATGHTLPSASVPPVAAAPYASGLGRFLDLLALTAALRTLDLGGNRMGPELFGLLCDALTLNATLRRLDVSGNALGPDGGGHLGRLLACNQRLQWVDAGSNGLGPDGADYFARQLEPNSALTDLRLGSNRFGGRGAEWLARAAANATALMSLDMDSNDIDAAGAGAVAAAVRTAPLSRLTDLQMSRNPIGNRGAARLAQELAGHLRLRRLGLAHCELTAPGAAAVGALAASLGGLRRLDVGANQITSAGAERICRWALAAGARLQLEELVLDGNLMDDAAAPALAALVERHTTLRRLRVRGNFLTAAAAVELARRGRGCTQLLELCLQGNNLTALAASSPVGGWVADASAPAASVDEAAEGSAQRAEAEAAVELRELERLLRRRRAGEPVDALAARTHT